MTYDGGVLALAAGTVSASVPVVDAWAEPADREAPRPSLEVVGDMAFMTDPATGSVHVVDLDALTVAASYELPEVPNEMRASLASLLT